MKLDKPIESMSLQEMFKIVMNQYIEVKNSQFGQSNPLYDQWKSLKTQMINEIVQKSGLDFEHKYVNDLHEDGKARPDGQGKWSHVFGFSIRFPYIKSTQAGVYIVYLFNMEKKWAYLTLSQGASEYKNSIPKLKSRIEELRSKLDLTGFDVSPAETGKSVFDASVIAHKKYTVEDIPNDEVLYEDLRKMALIYDQYSEIEGGSANTEISESPINYTDEQLCTILKMFLEASDELKKEGSSRKNAAIAVFGIVYGKYINSTNREKLLDVTKISGTRRSNKMQITNGTCIYNLLQKNPELNVFDILEESTVSEQELTEKLEEEISRPTHKGSKEATVITFGIRNSRSIKDRIKGSAIYRDGGLIDLGLQIADFVTRFPKYKEMLPIEEITGSLTSENLIINSDNDEYSYLSVSQIGGFNRVYYGTPGCGKSFHVENEELKDYPVDAVTKEKKNVFRTTFFQDYTNTDFVGQILPKINGKDVTYSFMPGPFTLALEAAIAHPEQKIALVIEELNRGNAASIFGDLFQLLDRDENGCSRYSIINVNILDYLQEEKEGKPYKYNLDFIKIPSNLFIYGTMNTSDQNVFTLDTAFKRRWEFKRISNLFSEGKHKYKDYFVPGLYNITWQKFAEEINKAIVRKGTSLTSEDKQIGKFFISQSMLIDPKEIDKISDKIPVMAESFAYKMFEYLWNDVAKFNRDEWFVKSIVTLELLISEYKKGKQVFVDSSLANALPGYTSVNEEAVVENED